MRVAIAVTHLLGTGHLRRALTLANAFGSAGHSVLVISGGMPVRGIPTPDTPAPSLPQPGRVSVLQLPPLRSDGTDFTRLLGEDGAPVEAEALSARRDIAVRAVENVAPDVFITELFPFGRRILRGEFLAMLDAARDALRMASVRDILAPPSKPEKAAKTAAIIAERYDGVLVHCDPATTRLEASWPVSGDLARRLHYTGYVAPPAATPQPDGAGTGEILVSAGGGSVGDTLFATALAAAQLDKGLRWRLLVGGARASARIAALGPLPANVLAEPARPDFRAMLHNASASISMCGYNTALDLLQSGVPAILVPFDDGGEVEQTLRANSLAALSGIQVLRSGELTPETLAALAHGMAGAARRNTAGLGFDGAARSVQICETLWRRG